MSVSNFPTSQNVSGSVVAFQGTVPWTIGSVYGNISGSVVAVPTGNQSVSGAVSISNFPTSQNVSGSVVAFQGGAPWSHTNVGSIITVAQGSVATVIIGGSIAASFTPPANQSVSGTVQTDVRGSIAAVIIGGSITTATTNSSVMLLNSTNVIGSVAVLQGTNPWVQTGSVQGTMSVLGTVPVTQATDPWIITGSIQGTFSAGNSSVQVLNFPANQSVSGTVLVNQGTSNALVNRWPVIITDGFQVVKVTSTSLLGVSLENIPSITAVPVGNQSVSGTVGASVIGLVPVNIVQSINQSVSGTVGASIIGLPPVNVTNTNLNVGGSVVAFQGTNPWVIQSIVGTYADDTTHTSGDKGILMLTVRNDAVASTASANLDYTVHAVDSAGRTLIKPFAAGEASVIGINSVVNSGVAAASVVLISAPGAGLKTYITDYNISNTGAATTLVKFADSDASVIGWTIAPAGGGSNHSFATPLVTTRANVAVTMNIVTATSVFAVVTGYKAP